MARCRGDNAIRWRRWATLLLKSVSPFHGNGKTLYLSDLTQFPRESATRFSRESRFALFLELL
jgi:hypothetical protein